MRIASAMVAVILLFAAATAAADTLSKVRDAGRFVIGFREDAQPFSYRDAAGEPAGYSVDLCRVIGERVKEAAGADVTIAYASVAPDRRIEMVTSGEIDIECGASTVTLERRDDVSFTLLTFVTGAEMLLKAESPVAGFADLDGRTVGVLGGTTTESGLRAALEAEGVDATLRTVERHDDGVELLRDGEIDAYFADRILLLGKMLAAEDRDAFRLSGEFYSYEPYAFMMRRGDDDLRLVADSALADLYRSGDIWMIYEKHFPGAQPSDLLAALYILQGIPVR